MRQWETEEAPHLPVSVAAAWTPPSWTPPQSAAGHTCAPTWAGRCRSVCQRILGCPGSWRGPTGWGGTCSRRPAPRWAAASWLLGAMSRKCAISGGNTSQVYHVMESLRWTCCLEMWNHPPYLHITLPNHNFCGVGVLDQLLQSLGVDVV